jgi:fibronectin-binding autotransporter adhesin
MGFSSFTENGAESLNLRVGGQSYNSMRMNVGGRIAYTWPINQKVLFIPEVRMFWQHEFLQNPTDINASLNGGPVRALSTARASLGAIQSSPVPASICRSAAYYNVDFASRTSIDNIVSVNLAYSF